MARPIENFFLNLEFKEQILDIDKIVEFGPPYIPEKFWVQSQREALKCIFSSSLVGSCLKGSLQRRFHRSILRQGRLK